MQDTPVQDDKRRAKGEETRNHILKCTISTLSSVGLSHLTLDKVAQNAGVSRGLVVFHFKSKHLLLVEVLEMLGAIFNSGWQAVKNNTHSTLIEKLFQLVRYDIDFAYSHSECISAWVAFWGESKGNALYHEFGTPRDLRYAAELEDIIYQIVSEQKQQHRDAHAITLGLNSMLLGFWINSHLDRQPNGFITNLGAARFYLSCVFPKLEIPQR